MQRVHVRLLVLLQLVYVANHAFASEFSHLNFTDPYPAPTIQGEPSQPATSIVFTESFEGVTEFTPGVVSKGWMPSNGPRDPIPFVHSLPGSLASGFPALTVEFWMKKQVGDVLCTIVHGPGWKIGINRGNLGDQISIVISEAKQGVYIGNIKTYPLTAPPEGQWHYYAITFDCHVLSAYIDGKVVYSVWQGNHADQIGPMTDASNVPELQSIEIGGRPISTGPDFYLHDVGLDEVRVSSVALTAAQVRKNFENYRLYNVQVFASPTGTDSAPGTIDSPKSLKSALSLAGPNTKITLLPGTYNGTDFKVQNGGNTPFTGCLILGQPGSDQAIIQVPAGSTSAATLTGAQYLTLRNITFEAQDQNALNVTGGTGGITLDSCRFFSHQNGIKIDSAPGLTAQNCIVLASGQCIAVNNSMSTTIVNNTIVGGSRGITYTGASGSMSFVNNLITGQSIACLDIAGGLTNIGGDGNDYDPSQGGSAAIVAGTSYSRTSMDALRKVLYQIDYPDDAIPLKLTAYGPENRSFSLPVGFNDLSTGDYSLSEMLGNPIDTGVSSFASGLIDLPSYDVNGAPRPMGNAIDSGAFESAGSVQATFNLGASATTSAGVYALDGTLVRTLWSGRRVLGGTITAYWNGLDDNNNIAPLGNYQIKAIAHNINYVWDGVIGNTSTNFCGPTAHGAFYPMQDLTFVGSKAVYVAGYNEGQECGFTFDTSKPQEVTGSFPGRYTRSLNFVTTDGTWIYFGDTGDSSLIVTALASNNQPVSFSGVTTVSAEMYLFPVGNSYTGISVGAAKGMSGLAVQTSGNWLFCGNYLDNTLRILDKRTGVSSGSVNLASLNITNPGRMACNGAGDLWMICSVNGTPKIVRLTGFGGTVSIASSIAISGTAVSVAPPNATSPNELVLVADNVNHQVKAFDNSGTPQWTFGQLGGYGANGPAVTNDKFLFTGGPLSCQSDGSFWVRDAGTSRVLHFSAARQYIEQIQYLPHNYVQTSDPNNPTRVFNNFIEFQVDYSKPLTGSQGWKTVNCWGAVLPATINDDYGPGSGIQAVCTLNGHTFAVLPYQNTSAGGRPVVELLPTGMRMTSTSSLYDDFAIEGNGSITRTYRQAARVDYYRRSFLNLDASNNPVWGPDVLIGGADAPWRFVSKTAGSRWNGDVPVGDFADPWRSTSTNLVIAYNGDRHSSGFHIGAIKPGGTKFLWQASPSGPMDGLGTFDNNVEYAGFRHVTTGRHILFQHHGEFWHYGQSNQYFHYFDNGLFVGQFGQPQVDGIDLNAPGGAGNSFSPTVVNVNGELYMWVNDESGHSGNHRWHLVGAQNIQELTATVTFPPTPVITSPVTTSGTAGIGFAYLITATHAPTSFSASGLPVGLSLNPLTGVISGIPTVAGTSSVALGAVNGGGTGVSTLTLSIAPGAAAGLSISSPVPPASAGNQVAVSALLIDLYGNTASGYVGTVKISSSDTQAVLPANYTFTASDAGAHLFNVSFVNAGAQSLTITDTLNTAVNGVLALNVAPGAVSVLSASVSPQPSVAASGSSVSVTLTDAFGNTTPSYRGTLKFSSTDSHAVLPADYAFTAADAGAHVFSVTFGTAGAQTLTLTDTVTAALTKVLPLNVAPGAANSLTLSTPPQPVVSGVATPVTAFVLDAAGNAASSYRGTVRFTCTDTQAVLPADYTFTAADAGSHTFSVSFETAGTQILTLTDTADSTRQGVRIVNVSSGAASTLTLSALPLPVISGITAPVTVALKDLFGNPATGYRGTVKFASSDPNSILPSSYTFTAADAGSHQFNLTFMTVGTQSLTVADQSDASLIASKTGINVNSSQNPLPPVITTAASASPNPVKARFLTTLSVGAVDPAGLTLTYSWTFGDNSVGTGNSVAHKYNLAGTYTATVTVSNGVRTATSSVVVSTTSRSSKPRSFRSVIKNSTTSQDTVVATGVLTDFPVNLNYSGATASVALTDTQATFLLSKTGKGTFVPVAAQDATSGPSTGTFTLKVKKVVANKKAPLQVPTSTTATFSVSLKGLNLKNFLSSNGVQIDKDNVKVPLSTMMFIAVGDEVFSTTANLNYTGQANRGGSLRLSK